MSQLAVIVKNYSATGQIVANRKFIISLTKNEKTLEIAYKFEGRLITFDRTKLLLLLALTMFSFGFVSLKNIVTKRVSN